MSIDIYDDKIVFKNLMKRFNLDNFRLFLLTILDDNEKFLNFKPTYEGESNNFEILTEKSNMMNFQEFINSNLDFLREKIIGNKKLKYEGIDINYITFSEENLQISINYNYTFLIKPYFNKNIKQKRCLSISRYFFKSLLSYFNCKYSDNEIINMIKYDMNNKNLIDFCSILNYYFDIKILIVSFEENSENRINLDMIKIYYEY